MIKHEVGWLDIHMSKSISVTKIKSTQELLEVVPRHRFVKSPRFDNDIEKLTTLKAEACQKVRVSLEVGEAYQVYAVLGDGRHAGGVSTTRVWIAPPGSEPTQPLSAPYSLRSCPEEEDDVEVGETNASKGCQGSGAPSLWVLLLLWLFQRFVHVKRIV